MKQGNGSEISSESVSGAYQCPVVFVLQATYCPLPWGGGMATDAPTWSRCLVSSLPRHVSVMSPEALAQAGARGGLVALERTVDRGKRPGGPDRLHGAQAAGPGTLTPGRPRLPLPSPFRLSRRGPEVVVRRWLRPTAAPSPPTPRGWGGTGQRVYVLHELRRQYTPPVSQMS